MQDMIVDSVNDATNWILEAVTNAGNGPMLSDEDWYQWKYRRNSINRFYASLGYTNINTCQKTYIEEAHMAATSSFSTAAKIVTA